ncbi:L,D-transpeptidase catalytic domain [Sinosporangium album]|uniref:L,D-transpeptidase catalytic domain n=2 Tax=Sinosporangium album TaxID=504805 RepID=A0A1G8LMT8_9ACTN|nr:L,D-transpeptidase catalytic domain [Sinosporangium album]
MALVASCAVGGSDEPATQDKAAADAVINVLPYGKAKNVAPDTTVLVAAQGGALSAVTVRAGGGAAGRGTVMKGVLSADRTKWRSSRSMSPGTTYTVSATATNPDGKQTKVETAFTTVQSTAAVGIKDITPQKGELVGVGMPIMITFDKEITNRVDVERNLRVVTSKAIEGAWHWVDGKTVHFRPRDYWPSHTKVKLIGQLNGVEVDTGRYATQDFTHEFKVGRSQMSVVNTDTHMMKVRRDGEVIKNFPISAGRGGTWKYYTTNGKHVAMSMEPVVIMDSSTVGCGPGCPGYYRQTVYSNVRISNSGEYVHGAPWSVGSQGNSNVSHGCVNVGPENARWFMKNTLRGDPIDVVGSPRQLEPFNGWGQWQMSWHRWVKGSAVSLAFDTEKL